jgi:hypothetical protein
LRFAPEAPQTPPAARALNILWTRVWNTSKLKPGLANFLAALKTLEATQNCAAAKLGSNE